MTQLTTVTRQESDGFWAIAAAASVGFLVLVWTLWWRPWLASKKPVEALPMLPNSHWLFGHLLWVIRTHFLEKQQALVDYADDYGRCCCWLGPRQASVSLTHCKDGQQLLQYHHTRISAPILKRHFEMLAGRKNLLLLNGKEWKYYQSALKSALRQKRTEDPTQLQTIVINTTTTLVQNIKAKIKATGGPSFIIPMDGLMKMITQDVFGLAAFSHDFACCATLQLSRFGRAFESMENDIVERCRGNQTLLPQNLFYWIPTRRNREFMKNRRFLRTFLSDIVRDRFANQTKNRNNDILGRLIDVHYTHAKAKASTTMHNLIEDEPVAHGNENDQRIIPNEEDLVDILLSVLLAGYDTVSTALTYAVFLISRHPDWEALCLEEIKAVNDGHENKNNNANLEKIKVEYPLCLAVIIEALRLYPVSTSSSRSLEKPLQLRASDDDDSSSVVTLPPGCHVGVSFWLIHRSEQHFPKPLEFRPDRWVTQCPTTKQWMERSRCCNEKLAEKSSYDSIPAGNSNAFFAFSAGSRSCPGKYFALEEATLAFAVLIRDLKFQVDPDYDVEIEWKVIVQKPKGGIPARIFIR